MWSTTGQSRLSDLAILSIESELAKGIEFDEVRSFEGQERKVLNYSRCSLSALMLSVYFYGITSFISIFPYTFVHNVYIIWAIIDYTNLIN